MTCNEVITHLYEYLELTADAARLDAFRRHLALCDGCTEYLASYSETVRLARVAGGDPQELVDSLPPELVAAIVAATRS